MPVTTRLLAPALWPAIEKLFGSNGACGGCWCMHWRQQKGEKWENIKGDEAKRRFKKLVESGEAKGVLAFDGAEPVGWCAFGPRQSYVKLDRAPSLRCDDAERVWSLPCFFVRREWRSQGVAGALIDAATAALKREGAEIVEAYPAKPTGKGQMPAAFAWTGLPQMFTTRGFKPVDNKSSGKIRMRLELGGK